MPKNLSLYQIDKSKKLQDIMDDFYSDYVQSFEIKMVDDNACLGRLEKRRKWKIRKGQFKCICGNDHVYSHQKKNHWDKKRKTGTLITTYTCDNPKCRKQHSLTSGTIFRGKRSGTPLTIWFYLIYIISLLDGEIPYYFIKERYSNYESPDGRKISFSQVLRIAIKIKKEVFDFAASENRKKTYLRLIGELRCGSFLKWHKTTIAQRRFFKIVLKRHVIKKKNDKASRFAKKYNLKSCANVHYLQSRSDVNKNDWLLVIDLKDNKIGIVKWLHVSDIIGLSEVDGYSHQAVQLRKNENTLFSPFKVTKKLKDALATLVRKYRLEGLGYVVGREVFSPPNDVLDNIAHQMTGESVKAPKGSV